MSKEPYLTGELAHDATALWQELPVLCGPEGAEAINRLYRALAAQSLIGELELPRNPQVSFNPRPARLVRLGQQFCGLKGLTATAALLLTGAAAIPGRDALPTELWPALDLANAATALLRSDSARIPSPSSAETLPTNLAALRLLDDVRHLHLRTEFLDRGEAQLSSWRGLLRQLQNTGIPSKLAGHISAALDRASNTLESRLSLRD